MSDQQGIGEKVKEQRKLRAWPQEQLAEVAGVSVRTIQRIEAGSIVEFETLKALAAAFDMDVLDFTPPPAGEKEKEPAVDFLARLVAGRDLCSIAGGIHAFQMDHDEPKTREEAESIGNFLQDIKDLSDIWDDMEPSHRVEYAFNLTEKLDSLDEMGFWVFGGRARRDYIVGDGADKKTLPMVVGVILVLRKTNPRILKVDSENHSFPAVTQ